LNVFKSLIVEREGDLFTDFFEKGIGKLKDGEFGHLNILMN
jgi:hypothetical protein